VGEKRIGGGFTRSRSHCGSLGQIARLGDEQAITRGCCAGSVINRRCGGRCGSHCGCAGHQHGSEAGVTRLRSGCNVDLGLQLLSGGHSGHCNGGWARHKGHRGIGKR